MSNLVIRLIVAAFGIPLLLYVTIHGEWFVRALVIALQVGMIWEWQRLSHFRSMRPFLPGVLAATVGIDVVFMAGLSVGSMAVLIALIGLVLLAEVFRPSRTPLLNLGSTALYLIYVAVPLGLWTLLPETAGHQRFAPAGALTLLFVSTWFCDSGAYFVGRAIGRHKLYPAASPNKTIEGFVGGLAAAAVVLPIAGVAGIAKPSLLDYVVLPLIVGLAGQVGDLLESLIKREVGVKDSSAMLPGHGGLLDRFDSLLLSTPFLFAYLSITCDCLSR